MKRRHVNRTCSSHRTCLDVAEEHAEPGNYLAGVNISGFVRVVNAMLDQRLVCS